MNYKNIIENFKNNSELRFLLMKLPITHKVKDLNLQMLNDGIFIITNNVKDLFDDLKGSIETIDVNGGSGWSVRTKDIHVHNNSFSRDVAVKFIFRMLNKELTEKDKPYIYNITLYILTHIHVFTNRIRYHLFDLISNEYKHLISVKQKKRIDIDMKQYRHIDIDDESEYDTEEETEDDYDSDYDSN